MSSSNPIQVQHCTLIHILFIPHKDLPPILTLHAVCVPCPQPSPARASTGVDVPSAPVVDVLATSIDRARASEARDTFLSLAHAREASSSEPPSTERCARLLTRRNLSVDSAPRWTDPTRAGTLLDALELACLSTRKESCSGTALCPPLFHPKITTSAAKQQSRSGPGPSLHKRRPTTSPVGFQLALGRRFVG